MPDHQDITLTIKLQASRWIQDEEENDYVRVWNGPETDDDDINLAASVTRVIGVWPFTKWKWRVWSPFGSESAADGSAKTAEDAMRAADEALLALTTEAAA